MVKPTRREKPSRTDDVQGTKPIVAPSSPHSAFSSNSSVSSAYDEYDENIVDEDVGVIQKDGLGQLDEGIAISSIITTTTEPTISTSSALVLHGSGAIDDALQKPGEAQSGVQPIVSWLSKTTSGTSRYSHAIAPQVAITLAPAERLQGRFANVIPLANKYKVVMPESTKHMHMSQLAAPVLKSVDGGQLLRSKAMQERVKSLNAEKARKKKQLQDSAAGGIVGDEDEEQQQPQEPPADYDPDMDDELILQAATHATNNNNDDDEEEPELPHTMPKVPQIQLNKESGEPELVAESMVHVVKSRVQPKQYVATRREPRQHTKPWDVHDTRAFYEALRSVGTDFSTMALLIPSRHAKALRAKYHSETKAHPELIKALLNVKASSSSEVNVKKIEDRLHADFDDSGALVSRSGVPPPPAAAATVTTTTSSSSSTKKIPRKRDKIKGDEEEITSPLVPRKRKRATNAVASSDNNADDGNNVPVKRSRQRRENVDPVATTTTTVPITPHNYHTRGKSGKSVHE